MNRSLGYSPQQSFNRIDRTSVWASAFISGVSAPGISTGVKAAVTTTAIVADAVVDVNRADGTITLGGLAGTNSKPVANVVADAFFGTLGAKAPDAVVSGSKKTVANDLIPSNYAPLTPSGKQLIRTTDKVVNSSTYSTAVNAASSLTVSNSGLVNTVVKDKMQGSGSSTTPTAKSTFEFKPYIPTADKTRVELPVYIPRK